MKGIKISDVELKLHEQLKNLDAEWIKRVLVGIISMVHDSFTGDTGGFTPDQDDTITLSPEKNASGYILILEDLFMPMLQVMSVLVTKSPKFLMMANDQSLDDAPFRISFLGHKLDNWESSSLERLDSLTPAARHSSLRQHDWLVTLIGCRPSPHKTPEQRILPRLKLGGTAPPNFDFTKLRQNLIDQNDDTSRVRLLRGLHEKLWHEDYKGMERFLQRLGVPDRCFELLETVIKTCDHCNAFKPVPRRPRYGADLAGHFGDVLVIDLFFLWGIPFILMIDEATRYKVVAVLLKKDAKSLAKVLLYSWFR